MKANVEGLREVVGSHKRLSEEMFVDGGLVLMACTARTLPD